MNRYKEFTVPHPRVKLMTDIVRSYGPYRFFPTLTFNYALNDQEGIEAASTLVRRLNKKLLGKHWKKHGVQPLRGIATLERTRLGRRKPDGSAVRDRASCHFHFLIQDHDSFAKDESEAMCAFTQSFETVARALNLNQRCKLVGRDGAVVRSVDTDGVMGYVVKDARFDSWLTKDRFFLLDESGLLLMLPDELMRRVRCPQIKRRGINYSPL